MVVATSCHGDALHLQGLEILSDLKGKWTDTNAELLFKYTVKLQLKIVPYIVCVCVYS